MKNLFLLIFSVFLFSCTNNNSDTADNDILMSSNFDSLAGWLPDMSVLANDKAHSGKYSLKVDQTREFALGYSTVLGELSNTRLRGIKLDAWVYLADKDATAKLAFIIKDAAGSQEILGDRIDLVEQAKEYGKWVKISKKINFPVSANYTSQLVIYLWRAGATKPAYIDDIQLTALR
ncbi:hypothetical protein [Hymenobacter volaticus]|uniref:CBM-cenC domain-containing protein n=1 Tax=Hymenobacter volaticus TaxID=2932254 RepID=A0ABY4G5Z1_9BACT|nr:hypothetical protein [Hymenobacter volaticus]UOQ66034.1 hypothetical protein MUN86_21385 [Hymenobacter volaticus]